MCQLTYRSDKPLDGAVKAPTIAINVTSEPVGGCTRKTRLLRRHRTSRDELYTNKLIVFGPAGNVTVGTTPSANSAGDITVGVASPADLAEVVSAGVSSLADLAGDATVGVASSAVSDVASSADLAEDATVGVASSVVVEVVFSVDFPEVASSADLAGDITVGVLSSADPASVVTTGVTLREECGDGVGVPGDYDCVCDDFAEAASAVPPALGVCRLFSIDGPWGAVHDGCLPGYTV